MAKLVFVIFFAFVCASVLAKPDNPSSTLFKKFPVPVTTPPFNPNARRHDYFRFKRAAIESKPMPNVYSPIEFQTLLRVDPSIDNDYIAQYELKASPSLNLEAV